jgi:hypothetical protein
LLDQIVCEANTHHAKQQRANFETKKNNIHLPLTLKTEVVETKRRDGWRWWRAA